MCTPEKIPNTLRNSKKNVGSKTIGVAEKCNLDSRKQQNEMGIAESVERDDDDTLVSRAPVDCYREEKVPSFFMPSVVKHPFFNACISHVAYSPFSK